MGQTWGLQLIEHMGTALFSSPLAVTDLHLGSQDGARKHRLIISRSHLKTWNHSSSCKYFT